MGTDDEGGNITTAKKLYSMRFDESLITQVDELAKGRHTNRTQYITDLIVKALSDTHTDKPVSNSLN